MYEYDMFLNVFFFLCGKCICCRNRKLLLRTQTHLSVYGLFYIFMFIFLLLWYNYIVGGTRRPGVHHPSAAVALSRSRSSFRPASRVERKEKKRKGKKNKNNIIPDSMIIDNNYNIYRPAAADLCPASTCSGRGRRTRRTTKPHYIRSSASASEGLRKRTRTSNMMKCFFFFFRILLGHNFFLLLL